MDKKLTQMDWTVWHVNDISVRLLQKKDYLFRIKAGFSRNNQNSFI